MQVDYLDFKEEVENGGGSGKKDKYGGRIKISKGKEHTG